MISQSCFNRARSQSGGDGVFKIHGGNLRMGADFSKAIAAGLATRASPSPGDGIAFVFEYGVVAHR
jgi:hypothetical protein